MSLVRALIKIILPRDRGPGTVTGLLTIASGAALCGLALILIAPDPRAPHLHAAVPAQDPPPPVQDPGEPLLWSIQETPTDRTLRGVDFVDPLFGWAVGGEGREEEKDILMRTMDGGETWRRLPFPLPRDRDRNLMDVDFVNRNTGWAIGVRGTILRTDDGGQSWRQQDSGTTRVLRRVQFLNINTGFVTVARERFILRTDDGGASWRRLDVPEDDGLSVVFFLDERLGWGHGGDEVMLRTTDGGETWENLDTGSDRRFYGLFFLDEELGWISGSDIRKTTDGGDTWVEVHEEGKTIERLHFTGPRTGLGIGDEGRIIRTEDGGDTWEREAVGLTRVELIDMVVVNPMHAWAVGSGGVVLHRFDPAAVPTATPTTTPSPTPTPTNTPTPTPTATPSGPWLTAGDPAVPVLVAPGASRSVRTTFGNMPAQSVITATLDGPVAFDDGRRQLTAEITGAGQGSYPLVIVADADAAAGTAFRIELVMEGATAERRGVIAHTVAFPRTDNESR